MREKWQKQMPLMAHITDHSQAQELEMISDIIDTNPTICSYILQDLNKGKVEAQRSGAKGMSAEQVLTLAAGAYVTNPKKIRNKVAAGGFGMSSDGQSIVRWDANARRLFADIKNGNLS